MIRTGATALGTVVLVVGTMWGLGITPIVEDIKSLKDDGKQIQETFRRQEREYRATFVSMADSNQYRARIEGLIALLREDDKRRETAIHDLQASQISRTEMVALVANLQRQLDELTRSIGGLYPLGKVIDDGNKRIDQIKEDLRELNRLLYNTPKKPLNGGSQ